MPGRQRQQEDDHIGSERKRSTEWSEAPGSNPTEMPSYVLAPRFRRELDAASSHFDSPITGKQATRRLASALIHIAGEFSLSFSYPQRQQAAEASRFMH